jgi:Tol biopolymer transport system component
MKHKILLVFLCSWAIAFSSCDKAVAQQPVLLIEQRTTGSEPLRKIYSVYPDGTRLQQLFQFPRGSGEYWLSPTRKQLALLTFWGTSEFSAQTLTIIDLLSGDILAQVSDAGYTYSDLRRFRVYEDAVVWSPQGDKLIFERNAANNENTDLWVFDLSSDAVIPLTEGISDDIHPSWSPDGSQIAFTSWLSCGQRLDHCPSEQQFWDVMVVDSDGQNPRQITDLRSTNLFAPDEHFSTKTLCNLTWSPDGQYIAFENSCLQAYAVNPHNIFVADAGGDRLERVTDFALDQTDLQSRRDHIYALQYSLKWSPAGDVLYIGYTQSDYLDFSMSAIGGFVIIDMDKSLIQYSPEIFGLIWERSWSPDIDQFVMFTERLSNKTRTAGPALLGTIDVSSGNISLSGISSDLPYGSCDERKVYWSSDGQYVAYAMAREGETCVDEELNRGIVVISLPDGQVTNIVESLAGDNHPIGWMIIDDEG